MHLIDSHVHLSSFNAQHLQKIFKDGEVAGIREWILAGYNSSDWQKQKIIQKQNSKVHLCFGLHPWQVLAMSDETIETELKILEQELPQAQGCGETGIDGFRAKNAADLEKQERVFLRHLELNKKTQLPLVLHIVKSHERSLEILKNYSYRGIVHGYSASWEIAKQYIDIGYKISLGRGIFQKVYNNLKETAAKIAMQDFVIESDSFAEEGVAEDPVVLLKQVEATLAALKGVSREKICASNYENVKSIFA